LKEIAFKRIVKNNDNKINLVFTNSASLGIVNQRDYFDKDIANQNNLSGYFVIEKNDFVYNPRISSSAPVGPISRNHLDVGVMSPLYTVFRFNKGDLDYLECFFNSTVWHKHMEEISNSGARDDRMSFSGSDFFKMPILFPEMKEQRRISSFLSSIDRKIKIEERISKNYEQQKNYLLQNLFI
jgi:type I restriction enzyme S subunit